MDKPNINKTSNFRKKISDLKAEFDQKKLGHIIAMKKINQKVGQGYMGKSRRDYGP